MPTESFNTEKLSVLDRDTIISEITLAELLGKCTRTIKRLEQRGHLPQSFKFGGENCFIVGQIIEHFHKRSEEAQKAYSEHQSILESYLP
jgi:predicted DNA-binding transcriptional regulator AlpA